MRLTYTPGQGFPKRLRSVLLARNLRPRHVEKAGVLSEDTLGRWTRGETYPEQQLYYNLAKHMGLNSQQAGALLREPGEPALKVTTSADLLVLRFSRQCEALEKGLASLDGEQTDALLKTVKRLAENVNKRAKQCSDSTTTRKESGSSSP